MFGLPLHKRCCMLGYGGTRYKVFHMRTVEPLMHVKGVSTQICLKLRKEKLEATSNQAQPHS